MSFPLHNYPDTLGVETSTGAGGFAEGAPAPLTIATLVARGDDPAAKLAEISRSLNATPPVTDVSDPNDELRLLTAARLQMTSRASSSCRRW